MFFQFLVEDESGGKLIDAVMLKYKTENDGQIIEYNIRCYKGIGGFPKGKDAKNIKSQQLLNDLPKRLKALSYALMSNKNAAVFIILDNDTRDVDAFENQLYQLAQEQGINLDYVFCIAVEECEAWLLGDIPAIIATYPHFKDRILQKANKYDQDSICGTWEILADMLSQKGINDFRKKHNHFEIGRCKFEWAEKIGEHLDIRSNKSPSFQKMLREMDARVKLYS